VDTGPVTVTLEFLNDNAGSFSAPSIVHDGNGCQGGGKNVVKALPGGWIDDCLAGISGDWIVFMVYRQTGCDQIGVTEEIIASNRPAWLLAPHPNPLSARTNIEFVLAEEGAAALAIYDLSGRRRATLLDGIQSAGRHVASWDGRSDLGARLPAGIYFVALETEAGRQTCKIVVQR
jgi:hypothetical protein